MKLSRRLATFIAVAPLLSGCAALGQDRSVVDPLAVALSFRVDEDLNRLVVTETLGEADWNRIEARVAECTSQAAGAVPLVGSGAAPWMNEPADSTSQASLATPSDGEGCGDPQGFRLSDSKSLVRVGDFIDFCGRVTQPDSPPPLGSVEVQLRDLETDQVIDGYLFSDFAAC